MDEKDDNPLQWALDPKAGYSSATAPKQMVLADAMAELCRFIVRDVLPQNRENSWDYLRLEIWPDSGRVIVFPATQNGDRREKRGCQIVVEAVLQTYDELADSDIDDEAFTQEVRLLYRRIANSFLHAAKGAEVLKGIAFQVWPADAEKPFLEAIL